MRSWEADCKHFSTSIPLRARVEGGGIHVEMRILHCTSLINLLFGCSSHVPELLPHDPLEMGLLHYAIL